jgi:hypothetical protein
MPFIYLNLSIEFLQFVNIKKILSNFYMYIVVKLYLYLSQSERTFEKFSIIISRRSSLLISKIASSFCSVYSFGADETIYLSILWIAYLYKFLYLILKYVVVYLNKKQSSNKRVTSLFYQPDICTMSVFERRAFLFCDKITACTRLIVWRLVWRLLW